MRLAAGVARNSTIVAKEAVGCWLTGADGRTYLDMTSGIGALSTGHSHPRVVAAAQQQVGKLVHAQQNCVATHEPQQALLASLARVLPPQLDTVFFTNSGSEAVENSVKLARKVTGRPNVISFVGGFHGRTLGCMSLSSSKVSCRQGFQPLMPGVFHVAYPQAGRGGEAAAQLDNALVRLTAPDETAAVLIEPVLGEGGVHRAEPDFMHRLRDVCDRHGILWISDEVQTGAGRTGAWWGYEHFGVEPDVVAFGKGVASGFPLAGVVARQAHFDCVHANGLGGTYNGNAVASAAAHATLEVIHDEDLVERARQRGAQLATRLRTLPLVTDVRHYGLMVAVELDLPPARLPELLARAQHEGLLLLGTGLGATVRLLPPLTISSTEIGYFIRCFRDLLASMTRGVTPAEHAARPPQ